MKSKFRFDRHTMNKHNKISHKSQHFYFSYYYFLFVVTIGIDALDTRTK